MTTTTMTMEARLAAIGRRIDDLYPNTQDRAAEAKPRIQRHVDALWQKEVSARAVVRDAYGESRQAVSEYADVDRLPADGCSSSSSRPPRRPSAPSWPTNAHALGDAVEEELEALDLYLERLQARAATKDWKCAVDGRRFDPRAQASPKRVRDAARRGADGFR